MSANSYEASKQGHTAADASSKRSSAMGIGRSIAVAVVVTAVMIGVTNWIVFSPQADAALSAPAVQMVIGAPFEYFPDQYRNAAQHAEEHIQAF